MYDGGAMNSDVNFHTTATNALQRVIGDGKE
jgi:hypothetical protein